MLRLVFTSILAVGLASAQLQFEVASIKPADPNAQGTSIMTDKVGGLNATNVPLRALITMAYEIRDFQLSGGPGWIGSERFDITAKPEHLESPPELTDDLRKVRDQRWRERVRSLLADRFGLVVHRETKERPIYILTVAKGGPKLTIVVPKPGNRRGIGGNRGRTQGYAAPMSMLATNLANTVGRPVVDKTGLTENYDWVLEWTPDFSSVLPGPDAPKPEDMPGPTIFTALQEQLGLRLEPSKGPVETIVIDHVDRPSAN